MIRDNLPLFVTDVADMADLLAAEQPELDAISAACDTFLLDTRIATAGAAVLTLWERFFGFEPAPGWTAERRRERLKSRAFFEMPVTAQTLAQFIEQVGGVACTVTEDGYYAHVKFTGQFGIPKYFDDIKAEVELIRPFHVVIFYEMLYPVLRNYKGYRLAELKDFTLAEINAGAPLQNNF